MGAHIQSKEVGHKSNVKPSKTATTAEVVPTKMQTEEIRSTHKKTRSSGKKESQKKIHARNKEVVHQSNVKFKEKKIGHKNENIPEEQQKTQIKGETRGSRKKTGSPKKKES